MLHNALMERRREARYAAEEAVVLSVLSFGAETTYMARITDVSRSGIRLEAPQYLPSGSEIAVGLRGSLVFGNVRHCKEVRAGWFSSGVQITRVSEEFSEVLAARSEAAQLKSTPMPVSHPPAMYAREA